MNEPDWWLAAWHPATVVAHVWARAVIARVGRDRPLATDGTAPDVTALRLPAPPRLPEGAVRGVLSACHRTGATCLPRSLVRQRWELAQGRPRDLVIGVTAPSSGFRAHAWLAGDPEDAQDEFTELTRRPPEHLQA